MRAAPSLNGAVIPPSPQVARDKMQAAKTLDMGIVPPPPTDSPRDVISTRVRIVNSTNVVPPPVSTPERKTSVNDKLLLPAPSVIAPSPANVTRELNSLGSAEVTDVRTQVVAPPVQVVGEVSGRKPADGIPRGTGDVVPPPPQVGSEVGSRTGSWQTTRGISAGDDMVVPPPPIVSGGVSLTGRGPGTGGMGSGGPLDAGAVLASPRSGENSEKAGVVVSNQPGQRAGLPGTGGTGSLVLSPAGSGKTGLGGNGLGSGMGRGSGPGSGMEGKGPGAGKTGTGRGSDPEARPGISPYPGPGGAGKQQAGLSATPGISVQGGSTPTIPSFSADGNAPTVPGHSGTSHANDDIDIIVEGTPGSGGGFNYYGKLPGQNYTLYFTTAIGLAVMQYADATSATHTYAEGLTAPKTIRIDLPPGLQHLHISIACILDRSGQLQDLRLLDSAAADATAKVLAALHSWKFIPAKRGSEPVEVNAILGFNIDTR
jgi:hypothetical protein